ncbi:MAG TPA: nucleotide exchange factor GrpE [Steroidobacteraceae bacterium]|nr:nucleotide exchange factor GrpE [Steroidobacteraceae bacterium]
MEEIAESLPPGDEADVLREQLAAAENAAGQARDQALRAVAEMENIRKRSQREVENAHRFALEKFAAELLAVRDSLELAVRNGEQSADPKVMLEGQQATLKLLQKAFEKFSVTQLDPLGEPFDPALHEAVLMQPSATAEPNSVLQVVQAGYQLNGRLLRPARVIVASAAAPAS